MLALTPRALAGGDDVPSPNPALSVDLSSPRSSSAFSKVRLAPMAGWCVCICACVFVCVCVASLPSLLGLQLLDVLVCVDVCRRALCDAADGVAHGFD